MGYRYVYDQTREGDGFYGGRLRKKGEVVVNASRPQFVNELFELFERQAGWRRKQSQHNRAETVMREKRSRGLTRR